MPTTAHFFRLFGSLWLEYPTPDKLSSMNHLLPLIRDLDRRTQEGWWLVLAVEVTLVHLGYEPRF
ncbi:hypothetical protein UA08_01725 [Talaromyces atroroseus]|uniref:Uncharacterized protein n=1 Tax=Talaromyces atroroseus TaxID=1441469 RepID=A0A1Q5QA87_TALAT|nr:hypothetical protein UA08_01725 [Talaromyces atroroseus]OKL62857.1 hypothetical protein UA08_01725 [Talaromyces atroroseus]